MSVTKKKFMTDSLSKRNTHTNTTSVNGNIHIYRYLYFCSHNKKKGRNNKDSKSALARHCVNTTMKP